MCASATGQAANLCKLTEFQEEVSVGWSTGLNGKALQFWGSREFGNRGIMTGMLWCHKNIDCESHFQ